MGIFDSHAHYDDERYNEDRDELLNRLQNEGVEFILNSGVNMKTTMYSIKMAEKYEFVYASIGYHPHEVSHMKESDLLRLEKLAEHKKVVAIGEIGLDYYYEHSPKEVQRKWFDEQLKLAKRLSLPVIIHSREAAEETFEIIKRNYYEGMSGVVHCYSGSIEMAKEYIKLGFVIGVGGVVTYKNARKLVEVVDGIDIEHILIETDCPYLTPEPYRGRRNDSSMLTYVVEKIADIKHMDKDEVIAETNKNAKKLFNIM